MKNLIYLFVFIGIVSLISCNKDDNTPAPQATNSLVSKIDGVSIAFDQVSVVKETYTDYVDLVITATTSGDNPKTIIFNVTQLAIGTDACYYFAYNQESVFYSWGSETGGNSFEVNVTENTTSKIKGTFSGTLPNVDLTGAIAISNGTFDISY
jgi:hypothetical protein